MVSCLESLTVQLRDAAGPCSAELTDIVESAWDTAGTEACGNDKLRFYVAKRNVILALMGCEAYAVDEAFLQSQSDMKSKEQSLHTLRSQHQTTGSANRFARLHGESVFNESSNASSHGEMDKHGTATETGDGQSTYRDDSKGNGFNNRDSLRTSLGTGESLQTREMTMDGLGDSYQIDCNFESSYTSTSTFSNAINVVVVAGGLTITGSFNEWRKFISRQGHEARQHSRYETVVGDGFKDLNGSASSQHAWLSQFFTDTEWHSLDTDIKVSHTRQDVRKHAQAQAVGTGNGLSEAKLESNSSAQGTAQSEGKKDSSVNMHMTMNQTGYTFANSQRFRNLRLLYDQLQNRILLLKKRLRFSSTPLVAQFPCEDIECHSQMPRNGHYSQLVAAGMQCYESTCSGSLPMNVPY